MPLVDVSHIKTTSVGVKRSDKANGSDSAKSSDVPREKGKVHVGGKNVISVCVLGSAKVGKTSIVRRIMGHAFQTQYTPTIYDSYIKHTTIRGEDVIIDLQDISGSQNFPAMEKRAIETANVILIVFSLEDFDSCQHAINVSSKFDEKEFTTPVIIVGNKSDLFAECDVKKRTEIEFFFTNTVGKRYIEMSAKYDRYADLLLKQIYEENEVARGPYRVKIAKHRILEGGSTDQYKFCTLT